MERTRDKPHNNLLLREAKASYDAGVRQWQVGRVSEAAALIRRAVELWPSNAGYHCNLGILEGILGHHAEAAAHARVAIRLQPDLGAAWGVLGVAMERMGSAADAVSAYDRAICLVPSDAALHTNRGNALLKTGNAAGAIAAHRRALAIQPNLVSALQNLAAVHADRGDLTEAVANYRLAWESRPDVPSLGSEWLYTSCFDPDLSPGQMRDRAKDWAQRGFSDAAFVLRPPMREMSPDRRLRVGYLSPDFRQHTIRHLIEPVLAAHDRGNFEIYCYSAVTQPDSATAYLKQLARAWRDIATLSDEAAAALIQNDQIDILVDLAGHMAGSRLPVLARKPAPIQIQLGYASTTGLDAMDYRITDPWSDPPGCDESIYTEQLWRMPNCAWCYKPDERSPEVGPLPTRANGFITFGSLNRPLKLGDPALRLWASVLADIPQSKLIVLGGLGGERNSWLGDRLVSHGIPAGRFQLIGPRPRWQYLELFSQIDIALDPFPYNADTTTCDALWMGVPVITRVGNSFLSRRAASHLHQVGLDRFACASDVEFRSVATALAQDRRQLEEIRSGLRGRLLSSPLADGTAYTRELEGAFRVMWRRFISGRCAARS